MYAWDESLSRKLLSQPLNFSFYVLCRTLEAKWGKKEERGLNIDYQ